jgi:hypothetical protein
VIAIAGRFIETLLGLQRSQWPLLPSTSQAFEWMSRSKFFALVTLHKAVMRTNPANKRSLLAAAVRGERQR